MEPTEAHFKCPKNGCFYPNCDRLMEIHPRKRVDDHGNPIYTAYCEKTGEVVDGVRESELIWPPKKESAAMSDPKQLVEQCAAALDDVISKVAAGDKGRYLALDPNRTPMITALYPLTEQFVLTSATDEEWHLMQCHATVFDGWICRFNPVFGKFAELFEEMTKAFPNAPACADAERKCKFLLERISYQGNPNYLGPRMVFDKRSIADFYQDFMNALAALSDFVMSKDKPITKSGKPKRKPAPQKRGPRLTNEQESQIRSGIEYIKNHPKKWTDAARHALEMEQAKVDAGVVETDGYIKHSGDYETALAALAKAVERQFKPKRG